MDYDLAATRFGEILVDTFGTRAGDGWLLRDLYGKLAYITPEAILGEGWERAAARVSDELGAYASPKSRLIVSLADDPDELNLLRTRPSIRVTARNVDIRMIDHRLAGSEWLTPPVDTKADPTRLLFYSIKGGVGRSTALAVAAADLAASGHNVLIIDLDLEAPGQGSLLLRPDGIPSYGVIDWFAVAAAGADTATLLPDMIGACPFTSGAAVVDVVPAVGGQPGDYLSKLARAYAPGSAGDAFRGFNFPRKAEALVTALTSLRSYDAVLIDARAGLHETSGGLLLGLGAKSLIFGVDTPQTFDDYRLMFQALRHAFDPKMGGADTRFDLKMVHAKAPRDVVHGRRFLERSWDLWSETLYDEDVSPDPPEPVQLFNFDLTYDDAPHFPLRIIGDDTYARFDPRESAYSLSREAYRPVFGDFLDGIHHLLEPPE